MKLDVSNPPAPDDAQELLDQVAKLLNVDDAGDVDAMKHALQVLAEAVSGEDESPMTTAERTELHRRATHMAVSHGIAIDWGRELARIRRGE